MRPAVARRRRRPLSQAALRALRSRFRKKIAEHEAEPPEDLWDWMRATLLYAMVPYDLSFFGMMRQPLLFAINMVFFFPLWGVDSIAVIILWACSYT